MNTTRDHNHSMADDHHVGGEERQVKHKATASETAEDHKPWAEQDAAAGFGSGAALNTAENPELLPSDLGFGADHDVEYGGSTAGSVFTDNGTALRRSKRNRTLTEKARVLMEQRINKMERDLAKYKTVDVQNDHISSHGSRSSHSISSKSSRSSSIVAQREKLEKARLNLTFANREAEIKKQEYEVKTKQELLEKEKELAIAQVEYAAAAAAAEDDGSLDSFELNRVKVERTSSFVNSIPTPTEDVTAPNKKQVDKPSGSVYNSNPVEKPSVPGIETCGRNSNSGGDRMTELKEFSNFLAKRDLLMTRFMTFSDQPQAYPAWKANFKGLIEELGVGCREELDLLSKYLGPQSVAQANSLRNANVNNPSMAVLRIWERLEERYGRPEMIDTALRNKVTRFPKITHAKDNCRLYELADIVSEIDSLKNDPHYRQLLAYYDTSAGVNQILNKLPYYLQQKWMDRASKYKHLHNVTYPPFGEFATFLREMSNRYNDPSLTIPQVEQPSSHVTNRALNQKQPVYVRKTGVTEQPLQVKKKVCTLHGEGHTLNDCRLFRRKPIDERKQILKENKLCYKCCETSNHNFRNCETEIKCGVCGLETHCTAMHQERGGSKFGLKNDDTSARNNPPTDDSKISTKCTKLCGDSFTGRSCSKTVLVNIFPTSNPENSVQVYAVHDDQSNRTLGSTALFDKLGLSGETHHYSLTSCSGHSDIKARQATGLTIQSIDGSRSFEINKLVECNVPIEQSEIPTPEVALCHPHLSSLSSKIPPLNVSADIGLLIGRDIIEAHHVEDQIIGPRQSPFAQKLPLGWVIIGEVCLGNFHKPRKINVFKTVLVEGERPTIFDSCNSKLQLNEKMDPMCDKFGDNIFRTSEQDDSVGLSQDDRAFIELMENTMTMKDGQWMAPLPFKQPKPELPSSSSQAFRRAQLLDSSLKRDKRKCQHMVEFMDQILQSGAAEVAPPLSPEREAWYLPLFGVYHPRKPDKIRGVFDSSAQNEGCSLNNVLLSGPNMTNSLLGVLLRFRSEQVAVKTDIQQMFYSFLVDEEHRDYLRFFWYKDNKPGSKLIEYRMRVHVFGNTPSPSVATFGIRRAVRDADAEVKRFVERDFYVDDGLASRSTTDKAVSLVRRTQKALHENGQIKLHKIASNSVEVMSAFPLEDLDKDIQKVDMFGELPVQASLGLLWDLNMDVFTFNINPETKPFTRRGVLSTISSIFDPLGFLTPVTVSGRMMLREMTDAKTGWDEPLSERLRTMWDTWTQSLADLNDFHIPRMYTSESLSLAASSIVHVFSDASEKAVSAVAYIRAEFGSKVDTGFLMGKSRLSPPGGSTIPRLELCAAVLATELGNAICEHLDVPREKIVYHTDSKVVLGYLNNRSRRFYTYVSNRVETVLKRSKAEQWQYVSSQNNPADLGTRSKTPAKNLASSMWIKGPPFLSKEPLSPAGENAEFTLINPEEDGEIRPEIRVKKTDVRKQLSDRFQKFSTWSSLIRAISLLKRVCRAKAEKTVVTKETVDNIEETERFVIRTVQKTAFKSELDSLQENRSIPSGNALTPLSPIVDEHDILRVGGRIEKSSVCQNFKHPIIIPRKSHLAVLLARHFHEKTHHQGRLLTESAIRNNGYWIIGAKRLVSALIHKCVVCRKLRGKFQLQRMADLPTDRVTPTAPFTSVGVDIFGPWQVVVRKTRGGSAENKRWAVLFTCLATRAIHVEVIESMSSSSFVNSLRRFEALRGPVKLYRSDRGTNFVGALDAVNAIGICVEDDTLRRHLHDGRILWKFNPPHSSHMGGAWERLIGIVRRILDAILLNSCSQKLTHEVLCTFMCEVCAIVNSRPIAPISSDPDSPEIITPAMLLTQKTEPLSPLTTSTDIREIYSSQWKHVQILSNTFWKKWKNGYLQSLQTRRKWFDEQPNVKEGDVVLLRDKEVHRNHWPMAVIQKTFPSESDGKVRSVELRSTKSGKPTNYVRPVSEIVLLVE